MKDIVIAIDPDVDKSGFAILLPQTRVLEVGTKTFPELMTALQNAKQNATAQNKTLVAVVEAGWLNSSNWHVKDASGAKKAAKIGNNTGRNHEVGRKIIEMSRSYGIETIEQRPLVKIWKGKDRKITHKELAAFTGMMGKTNQESRDAALIAWVYAGLPIKINYEL
jgi:hypothetical protein